jgi:chemotaxis protein methyltransferase CheR
MLNARAFAAPQEPFVPPQAVADLACIVRQRFGLAHLTKSFDTLVRRLREAMHIARFAGDASAFVRKLENGPEDSPVVRGAMEAFTNQETCFFRELEQLESLVRVLVPKLSGEAGRREKLRILSAGCSTGEEVYSVAMLLLERMHLLWGRSLEVTGIDLCPSALARAREGLYPLNAIFRAGRGPEGWENRFFRREADQLVARDFLKAATAFEWANLVAAPTLAPLGSFDLILCRNVFIYFDLPSIECAMDALIQILRPGGVIVLGNAEAGMAAPLRNRAHRADSLVWFTRPESS